MTNEQTDDGQLDIRKAGGAKKWNHPGIILAGNFSFIIRELGIAY